MHRYLMNHRIQICHESDSRFAVMKMLVADWPVKNVFSRRPRDGVIFLSLPIQAHILKMTDLLHLTTKTNSTYNEYGILARRCHKPHHDTLSTAQMVDVSTARAASGLSGFNRCLRRHQIDPSLVQTTMFNLHCCMLKSLQYITFPWSLEELGVMIDDYLQECVYLSFGRSTLHVLHWPLGPHHYMY